MTATIARWTISNYHQMIETGLLLDRQVELLNGLIVEISPEKPDHADLSNEAMELFIRVAKKRYRVRPAKPITIPESNSEPEPDLALVKPQSYRHYHSSSQDIYLLIEFANTSLAKDTEEKRMIYASAKTQDYWVVNLRDKQLIVYRHPMNGDYSSQQRLTSGSLSPLAFPDIIVAVPKLFS